MKVSRYNHIFRADNSYFVFNAISDRFVSISDKIYEHLENGNVNSIKGEALDILMKRNIIVHDDTDEYLSLIKEYEDNLNSAIYDLTLLPTLDCNVHCWYCFEKQKKGSRLHHIIRESILAYIINLLNEKTISVSSI